MATKKRVLGKGLSALLKNPNTDITSSNSNFESIQVVDSVSEISIDQIEVNPFQPRKEFDLDSLQELAISIKELGIIQPLTVRKLGYDKFQLISGERRFRASQIAKIKKVPVYIRIANDQAMLEMALVENIQREELNPVEIAQSYQRLIDECKLTQQKMSERIGKKRSTIANYLRLLKLPAEILVSLRDGNISMGHARALVNIKNQNTQINIFRDALSNKFTVREIEQIVKDFGNSVYVKATNEKKTIYSFEHQKLANELSIKLEKKVKIKVSKNGKGKIEIPFNTKQDLYELISKFGL